MKITRKLTALLLAIITTFSMSISSSAYVMSNKYATIYYGSETTLTLQHNYDTEDVIFESSDPKIATIDENGVVKSVCPGECIITCTDRTTGETDECTIRVQLLWWKVFKNICYFIVTHMYICEDAGKILL